MFIGGARKRSGNSTNRLKRPGKQSEFFAPDERLTLQDAIADIDKATALDAFDAQLWNHKAAWLCLMDRCEEWIECADKSINLRPNGYAKPYQNKAVAYRKLKMPEDARENAAKTIEIARGLGAAGASDVVFGPKASCAISRKMEMTRPALRLEITTFYFPPSSPRTNCWGPLAPRPESASDLWQTDCTAVRARSIQIGTAVHSVDVRNAHQLRARTLLSHFFDTSKTF